MARQTSAKDSVSVAPAYDHAEMTTVAAAHVACELPGADAARRVTHRSFGKITIFIPNDGAARPG